MAAEIADLLKQAIATQESRGKDYGDSYRRFGRVMEALIPEGTILKTVDDWNRYGILVQIVGKLVRYTTHPEKGHLDSAHDIIVYAAILELLTAAESKK